MNASTNTIWDPQVLAELRRTFLDEAIGHLQALTHPHVTNEAWFNDALRRVHTIKGAAAIVDLEEIENIAHGIEQSLADARIKDQPEKKRQVTWLTDEIHGFLQDVQQCRSIDLTGPIPSPLQRAFVARSSAIREQSILKQRSTGDRRLMRDRRQSAQLVRRVSADDLQQLTKTVRQLADADFELPAKQRRQLIQLRRKLVQQTHRLNSWPMLQLFEQLLMLSTSLSARTQRQVYCRFDGAAIRLPHDLFSPLHDCLVALVRNAVVHGIEPSKKREQCGKPSFGVITVAAVTHTDAWIVEVSDDGVGVPADLLTMKPKTGVARIFDVGMTTAASVTLGSGRGAGLGIVQQRMHELGGHIEIDTKPLQGSSFRLYIPYSSTCDVSFRSNRSILRRIA